MGFKKAVALTVFFISFIAIGSAVLAEDQPQPATGTSPEISAPSAAAPQEKSDMQWAWGDVISIDAAAKTFTIKYLDYETDQEKELALTVDDKTTYENVKGLEEIKPKDTLSVDYTSANGKNVANNISLEKPDEAPGQTQAPEDEQAQVTPAATLAAPQAQETPKADLSATPAPAVEGQKTDASGQAAVEQNTPAAEQTTDNSTPQPAATPDSAQAQ